MLSSNRTRARRRTALLVAAVFALSGALALSSPALAAQDELSGGSVTLQLKKAKGLKLKPKAVTLTITGGKLDPVAGDGTVNTTGQLKAKTRSGKAKVSITSVTFGASGGPGSINARVGKRKVNGFGTLSGGTTTRQGFGASLSGINAKLGRKGARALNKRSGGKGKKKRGGASAAAAGRVKAGVSLGTVSATTIPKTVEVLPGGSLTLHTNAALITKLLAHCIDAIGALPPFSPGVYPLAPATQNPLPPMGDGAFNFPVTGGELAPDFSAGKVQTGGGQGITKNVGSLPLHSCEEPPAVGATVVQTIFTPDFTTNSLRADAGLPNGGAIPQAPVATIDFGTGTRGLNGNQVTVTGATVTFHPLAAQTLNTEFPNRSGDPSNDFSSSDVLGTIDLTATLR